MEEGASHMKYKASQKLGDHDTYVGYTYKTSWKQLNYSGLLLLQSQHTDPRTLLTW